MPDLTPDDRDVKRRTVGIRNVFIQIMFGLKS